MKAGGGLLILLLIGILASLPGHRVFAQQGSQPADLQSSLSAFPEYTFLPRAFTSCRFFRDHLVLTESRTTAVMGFKDSVYLKRTLLRAENGWLNSEFTSNGLSIIDSWKEDKKFTEWRFDRQLNFVERRELVLPLNKIKARFFNQDTSLLVYAYQPTYGQLPGKTGVAMGKLRYALALKTQKGAPMRQTLLSGLNADSEVLKICAGSHGLAVSEGFKYDSLNLKIYSIGGSLLYEKRLRKGTTVEKDQVLDMSFIGGRWIVKRCELRYDGYTDLVIDQISSETQEQSRITIEPMERQFFSSYGRFGMFGYVRPRRWNEGVNYFGVQVYDNILRSKVPRELPLIESDYAFYPVDIKPKEGDEWQMIVECLFDDTTVFKNELYGQSEPVDRYVTLCLPRVKVEKKVVSIKDCEKVTAQKSTKASYCNCHTQDQEKVTVSMVYREYKKGQQSIKVFYVNERKFVYDGKYLYNSYERIVGEHKSGIELEHELVRLYFNNRSITFSR